MCGLSHSAFKEKTMFISGFQKLTVLDFPSKVACIIFTAGCNFRCPFCHNASLVTHIDMGAEISESEIFSYLNKRQGIIEGVCITGGEPLMHERTIELIKKIKEMGFAVKLDTNGSYPDRLEALINEGLLDYVAMDIKNCKEKYAATAGCERISLDDIERSVSLLLTGSVDYEFRTTVTAQTHETQDIEKIAQWIKGAKRYFLQNFADSGDIISSGMTPVPKEKIEKMQQIAALSLDSVGVR